MAMMVDSANSTVNPQPPEHQSPLCGSSGRIDCLFATELGEFRVWHLLLIVAFVVVTARESAESAPNECICMASLAIFELLYCRRMCVYMKPEWQYAIATAGGGIHVRFTVRRSLSNTLVFNPWPGETCP